MLIFLRGSVSLWGHPFPACQILYGITPELDLRHFSRSFGLNTTFGTYLARFPVGRRLISQNEAFIGIAALL
jgi:hypothetical protein